MPGDTWWPGSSIAATGNLDLVSQ